MNAIDSKILIVMTGYYSPEVRRKAYNNGAMAFLRKPIQFHTLVNVVRLVVGHGLHFIGPVGADRWEKEEFQWTRGDS